jgi:hypothetical protein
MSFPFTHTPLRKASHQVSSRIAAYTHRSTETPYMQRESTLNRCLHILAWVCGFPAYDDRVPDAVSYSDLMCRMYRGNTIDERSDMNE